jgi:hypothetical protein
MFEEAHGTHHSRELDGIPCQVVLHVCSIIRNHSVGVARVHTVHDDHIVQVVHCTSQCNSNRCIHIQLRHYNIMLAWPFPCVHVICLARPLAYSSRYHATTCGLGGRGDKADAEPPVHCDCTCIVGHTCRSTQPTLGHVEPRALLGLCSTPHRIICPDRQACPNMLREITMRAQ